MGRRRHRMSDLHRGARALGAVLGQAVEVGERVAAGIAEAVEAAGAAVEAVEAVEADVAGRKKRKGEAA